MNQDSKKIRKILITLFFFLLAGLCEIGGGYLVWLWLREDMSWILGAIGGIIPTFQPSHFGRTYAAYGGIFIISSIIRGMMGSLVAICGALIIFYTPH